jgi:hypothetical protein
MSYIRVIPRDLFNESGLLKCIGRIYINLENTPGHSADLREEFASGEAFKVRQSPDDGSIYISNVSLYVRRARCISRARSIAETRGPCGQLFR